MAASAIAMVMAAATLLVQRDDSAVPEPTPSEAVGGAIPVADNLDGAHWYRTEWGWIVVDGPAKAAAAAADLRGAVAAFVAHFGTAPAPGLLVESRFASLAEQLPASAQGWLLPWSFAPETGAAPASASRCAAAQVRDDHHVEARSALRHELSHLFFLKTVIPNHRKQQYGGDAPDWLDEAAALAAETPEVAAVRRLHFAEQVRAGRLKPLAAFLVQPHPLLAAPAVAAAIAKARAQQARGPILIRLSRDEIGLAPDTVADFYSQSRAVLDYLVERTGDPRILARVAADISTTGEPAGWTTRTWLPAGLDADFRRWAQGSAALLAPDQEACADGRP